jgi:xanthine dehydrogenase YagR molybdenum-binding subunit
MPRLVRTEAIVEGRVEQRFTLVEDDHTPEYGDDAAPVGHPQPRLTAAQRLTGAARFTSDIRLPGILEARLLRSPHANARLTAIDLDAARAVPGVRAVLGPGEAPDVEDLRPLVDDPGFAGAAVAAVAADDAAAAEAALAALAPRYDPLPFVVDMDEALARQDLVGEPTESERGDTEAALAAADVTIEADYLTPAQLHNSMESHCAVADWRADGLTVWSSTQGIYAARSQLATAFGLEQDRVRVICEYMGGGFGSKIGCGPEGILAAALSRAAGRPVRLVFSRRDENLAAGFRTPTRFHFRIGAAADGTLQAIEAESSAGMGAGGWLFPALEPARAVYACPNVHAMAIGLRQNLGRSAAFRAPGVMEGTWAFEQALDELAIRLGIDPLELRRRNHADVDPQNGRPYTSKRLLECYDRAAELAGWRDRDRLLGDGRVRRGMGLAGGYWWGGGGPPAYAQVTLGASGRPTVEVGLQDLGTGVVTACAIVAAERLGVPPDQVAVRWGDTSRSPHGPFSGGSMTLGSIAPAVRAAAHDVRTQLLDLAAQLFEIGPDDLTLGEGTIRSVDGTLTEPIAEVTGKLGDASLIGRGSRGPNPDGKAVNTFGCQIAQVAVDTLTGRVEVERIVAVHDSGRIVNPLGARSQVEGGVLQGLGFALMEERVVDPTTGTVLNPGLEDYKVPTLADLPEIVCDFIERPDPDLALGVKGLGEPPVIPTAAAIGNALTHATGVRLREAPYTPRRVLEALA